MSIFERVHDYDLTDKAKKAAQQPLDQWPRLERNLKAYTMHSVATLIIQEANCRARPYVVKRLLSRLFKLEREFETGHILNLMKERADARKSSGAVSVQASAGSRREGDKINIV